jgi:hypothetical protein
VLDAEDTEAELEVLEAGVVFDGDECFGQGLGRCVCGKGFENAVICF